MRTKNEWGQSQPCIRSEKRGSAREMDADDGSNGEDVIEDYYRRYQQLKEETLNSKEYERKMREITGSSASKIEIKKKLKGLRQEVMRGYSKQLRPFLEKVFDRFDIDRKGYLSRDEANNLFRVYLLKERVLRANHNIKLKLNEFEKTRHLELRNFVKIDLKLDNRIDEDMITHAILQVYKRDYLPKVKQLWHDMYDKILANKNDLFSRSLFIEIDSDFDGKLLKEELVSNFTGSFVHLTHTGIKNISQLERKFYQNIFSPSLNEKVKKILSQKIKEQRVAQKQQREKDPPKDIDLKPEESRNPSDKPTTPIAKMKITRQKPLKLKLRKTVIADDGELLEPNQLSLLCLCFVVAIIAVVLVGDFTLLNTYIDKIMHRSEL